MQDSMDGEDWETQLRGTVEPTLLPGHGLGEV